MITILAATPLNLQNCNSALVPNCGVYKKLGNFFAWRVEFATFYAAHMALIAYKFP